MKRSCFLSLATAVFVAIFSLLAVGQKAPAPNPQKAAPSSNNATAEMREGERLFHENCGRCHNPPEDLSPREARAVVRQMRVRAILTDKDERALLKFLAP